MPIITIEQVRHGWRQSWRRGLVLLFGMRIIDLTRPLWLPPLRWLGQVITNAALRNVRRWTRP